MKSRKLKPGIWLWPVLSVLMLCGMAAESGTHVRPADADQHQARCRAAIMAIPMVIHGPNGTWSGSDIDVPASATQLLRPNIILSRQYIRQGSGEVVSLLIVDCTDARDLQGHYPKNCYPAQGQQLISEKRRSWRVGDLQVPGTEYHFSSAGQLSADQVVYNFFVTPRVPGVAVSHPELNGAICPDIASVYTSGEDYQRRYFGAAEFQLVSDAELTDQQRDQALADLLGPCTGVIRTLMNVESKGQAQ